MFLRHPDMACTLGPLPGAAVRCEFMTRLECLGSWIVWKLVVVIKLFRTFLHGLEMAFLTPKHHFLKA